MPNDNLFLAIKRYDKNKMKSSKIWNPYKSSDNGIVYNSLENSVVLNR